MVTPPLSLDPDCSVVRAGSLSHVLALMLRRCEDKGGPNLLLHPIVRPHDWLERGNSSGQRKV
jgi:hypothetical protein